MTFPTLLPRCAAYGWFVLLCLLAYPGGLLATGSPRGNKLGSFSALTAAARADHIMEVTDSLVEAHLSQLDGGFLEYRLDNTVRNRIINYLENWPKTSGRILARSARYFPIFEEQLAAAGMPLALKYVTVQESALRPYATSHVGAGGLWQLMPGTARELGLTVNAELDERLDAELGCAAGLQYLRYQYERYGDWGLALAAYNCGPGNVNRAIRRSGKREPTYYQIQRYLPRETRKYLPNIIAGIYLVTFYQHYDTQVGKMELDLQITEAMTVYRRLSIHRIAQITGLRPAIITELNPQYLRGYLPGLPGGHRLRLPKRVLPAFREYLMKHPAQEAEEDFFPPWATPLLTEQTTGNDAHYEQYVTTTTDLDTTLRQSAIYHQVPADRLAIWSRVGVYDTLRAGTQLTFYRVAKYRPYDPRVRNVPPAISPLMNLPAPPAVIPNRRRPLPLPPAPTLAPAPAPKKASLTERIRSWFN